MTVVFALLAGLGLGVPLGILYARWDQRGVYDLITATVDRITTAALFPGLKGVVDQGGAPDPRSVQMYADLDAGLSADGELGVSADEVRAPAWVTDDRSPAWDPYEEEKV